MSKSEQPEDARAAELVSSMRQGDERAFEMLFDAYSDRVAKVAYRYVGSVDTARDIVQDVFIAFWARRSELAIRGSVLGYLCGAARNRALMVVKHEEVVTRWQASVERDALGGGGTRSVANTGPMNVEREELAARLNAALETLAPRAKEIFLLHREQGLKPGEIAEVLGVAPETVYVTLSRALKKLAAELGEWREAR